MSLTVRDVLIRGEANALGDAIGQAKLVDIIAMLVRASTPTENNAAVSSNAVTLAAAPLPGGLLEVEAVTATVTGRKTIVLDASERYTPATGEVRWNGGTGLLFAAADAVTAADLWYLNLAGTNNRLGIFERQIGDRGEVVV